MFMYCCHFIYLMKSSSLSLEKCTIHSSWMFFFCPMCFLTIFIWDFVQNVIYCPLMRVGVSSTALLEMVSVSVGL